MLDLRKNKITFGIIDEAFNTMDSILGDVFNNPRNLSLSSMKVDIQETENEYVIDVDLPGVKKEDINIDIKDNILTISVNQEEITNFEDKNYIHRERKSQNTSRSFLLENVQHSNIKAKYDNGVLTLNIPKVQPKDELKIKID